MSDPASLQFDTAEPVAAAPAEVRCATCHAELGTYFQVNGAVACRSCRDAVVAAASASHLPTILKATGLGLVAAVVGSALYYGVAKVTGYEIGLISIAVGLLVGYAVRRGSRARGGWRYQAIAVALTYLSIASTYVPRAFEGLSEAQEQPAGEAASAPAQGPAAAPDPGAPATVAATTADAGTDAEPGLLGLLGALFLFTLALPFLAGFDNAMGLVIIAIGLYEAWKVNRIAPQSVTGPYAVGERQAADA